MWAADIRRNTNLFKVRRVLSNLLKFICVFGLHLGNSQNIPIQQPKIPSTVLYIERNLSEIVSSFLTCQISLHKYWIENMTHMLTLERCYSYADTFYHILKGTFWRGLKKERVNLTWLNIFLNRSNLKIIFSLMPQLSTVASKDVYPW